MSALFESGEGIRVQDVELSRNLEMRRVPFTSDPTDIEKWTLLSTKENWLYTAMLQTTLDGSEPAWSKAGWSFIPSNLSQVSTNLLPKNNVTKLSVPGAVNLTVRTTAIRADVECSVIETTKNQSSWVYEWNKTATTADVVGREHRFRLNRYLFGGKLRTPVMAAKDNVSCCNNLTDAAISKTQYNPIILASWTENHEPENSETARKCSEASICAENGNFTAKWIRGVARLIEDREEELLVFSEVPRIQAINCMPRVDAVEADVIVDVQTGNVQTYDILSDAVAQSAAWTDTFGERTHDGHSVSTVRYVSQEMTDTSD
jgi:hypothetical protein